jgi:4-amino-4-deoxy-L-arabinose transferase-like glycosyltransferase
MYRTGTILLLILLLAAFLRLFKLGQISPPGFNQDEAVNAWNAWCLLKTGKDQTGASWPIFYLRTFGSNNTPLYIYSMIPFLAAGGLSIWTARFVSVFFGILCVSVIYYIGCRLFDRRVGLMAALLLALNPWHLNLSRWAIEAGICPLLGIVPLAVLLWAGMPLSNNERPVPKPLIAALAGAITGICCYGYWAARIFIPAFLVLLALVNLPEWLRCLKTRKGLSAVTAFIVGFLIFFGPLAWQHIFHPEGIARRLQFQRLWDQNVSFSGKLLAVASRYVNHFSPDFLFIRGDHYEIQAPAVSGEFHWYSCPLMILGLAALLWKLRSSRSARVLLALIAAYPLGDCFSRALSIHALRSSPGLCSLILLASVGAVSAADWLRKRNIKLFLTAVIIFVIAVFTLNIRYLYHFYGEYNRRSEIYLLFHTDLMDACKWLKPRLDDFDAVFCTTEDLNMPYVVFLVALNYDPNRWFSEPKEFFADGEFDYCTHYGKIYFMYKDFFTPPDKEFRSGRVLLIIRPGEIDIPDPARQIVRVIRRPGGIPTLWLCIM